MYFTLDYTIKVWITFLSHKIEQDTYADCFGIQCLSYMNPICKSFALMKLKEHRAKEDFNQDCSGTQNKMQLFLFEIP